jgi:DNA-binding transcriptional regulator YiaG
MTGTQLRALRQKQQLSLPQFAALINYHPNHIAQCERGERRISKKMERQILMAATLFSLKKRISSY